MLSTDDQALSSTEDYRRAINLQFSFLDPLAPLNPDTGKLTSSRTSVTFLSIGREDRLVLDHYPMDSVLPVQVQRIGTVALMSADRTEECNLTAIA